MYRKGASGGDKKKEHKTIKIRITCFCYSHLNFWRQEIINLDKKVIKKTSVELRSFISSRIILNIKSHK